MIHRFENSVKKYIYCGSFCKQGQSRFLCWQHKIRRLPLIYISYINSNLNYFRLMDKR
jgi:hypothetical protein